MREIIVYAWLLWKRMCKTPGYLVIFFLVPAILLAVSVTAADGGGQVTAAVYLEIPEEGTGAKDVRGENRQDEDAQDKGVQDKDAQGKNIRFLQELAVRLAGKEGAIEFVTCDSRDEVRQYVAAGKAECGYVIPSDLFGRLEAGRFTQRIESYESPQTSMHTICDEVFFAEIFSLYEEMTFGEQAAELFMEMEDVPEVEGGRKSGKMTETQMVKRAEELFEKYLSNGSTFQFTYENYQVDNGSASQSEPAAKTEKENRDKGNNIVPIRGIMALMIYVCGLCGTLDALEDEKSGRFARLRMRKVFGILAIFLPVFAMGIVAIILYLLTGCFDRITTELPSLLLYQIILTAYCCIIKQIWRREESFCAAMPVLILSAAVVCPVFADLSLFLPVFRVLEKMYPLSYYLR